MHPSLTNLHERILESALAALTRANTDAVYFDLRMEHRKFLAPLSAAHAGELLIKAIICKEHPLLLFRNLFERSTNEEIDLQWLIENGQTHDFSKLPAVMWASLGEALPHKASYETIRRLRNQVQHFTPSAGTSVDDDCLEFIYKNVDPLLNSHFGLFAHNYHEDEFDDYVIACLVRRQIEFSISPELELTEISLNDELKGSSKQYRSWLESQLVKIGKASLLT